MLRRLSTLVSVVSLVIGAVTIVLWVRSFQSSDQLMFHKNGEQWRTVSERGRIWLDNRPQVEANAEANARLVWPNFLRLKQAGAAATGEWFDRAKRGGRG